MTTEITWKDVVADALQQLGGEAHLRQIIALALAHPKAAGNHNVDAKVRQVVRSYKIFEPIDAGSGNYRLLAPLVLPIVSAPSAQQIALDLTQPQVIQPEAIQPEAIQPKTPTTKEITDTIQGQLLYIGQVYGFHTYAPPARPDQRLFQWQAAFRFGHSARWIGAGDLAQAQAEKGSGADRRFVVRDHKPTMI